MTVPRRSFLNRPLWGKPRPERERETDPGRVELALLRRERDTKNIVEFMTAGVTGHLLCYLVPFALITIDTPAPSTPERLWFLGSGLLYLLGIFGGWAAVFLVGVPVSVRLLSSYGVLPVYRRDEPTPWRRKAVVRIWTVVIIAAVVGPWGLAAVVAESPGEIVPQWAMFFGSLLVYSSPMLLAIGVSRKGEPVFCRRCGYPREAPAPDRCPECGNPWLARWRARMGQRHFRRGLISLACGLFVVGQALLAFSLLSKG